MPNTITSIFVSNPATEPVEAPHPNTGVYVTGTQAVAGGPWTVVHTLVSKTSSPPTITARLKNFPAVGASGVVSSNVLNNILATPTGAAATGTSSSAINVAVSSSANQTAYRLLAADTSTGPFTQVYQGATASYPHTGLSAAATKFYKWQYVGGGYYDDSPLSAVFSGAALAAGDGRVAWSLLSASASVNASSGAITVVGVGGLSSAFNLLPAPGSHITVQLPATAAQCIGLNISIDNVRGLGPIVFGNPHFRLDNTGSIYAFGTNVGTIVGGMYLRVEIAPNAADFLLQTSPDGVAYTTVKTVAAYAGYYNGDQNPMIVRVYASDSTQTVSCGPVTANYLVNGLISLAFDGNSLTAGTNSTTFEQNGTTTDFATSMSFPSQLLRSLTRNTFMAGNFGVSGQTTVQMSADAATQIDVKIAAKYRKNILITWEITNDYCNAGVTKEVAYSDFVTYCTNRRAAGWPVVVLNVINRTTNLNARTAADFTAAQTYWNGRLATEFATFADSLVDVNALSLQATAGWDGTHPSDAGYALVAAAIKTALTPLLA